MVIGVPLGAVTPAAVVLLEPAGVPALELWLDELHPANSAAVTVVATNEIRVCLARPLDLSFTYSP